MACLMMIFWNFAKIFCFMFDFIEKALFRAWIILVINRH
jgi:hypothetical protein